MLGLAGVICRSRGSGYDCRLAAVSPAPTFVEDSDDEEVHL